MRLIGGILLVAGLAALGLDLWHWGQTGAFRLSAAGELWFRLHPGSLNLTQAVVQRYLLPELWDPLMITVLLWPAAVVLAVPGLVLLALGSAGRRSRRR